MIRTRHAASSLLVLALGLTVAMPAMSDNKGDTAAVPSPSSQDASTKQAIQTAQDLAKAKKYEDALAKLRMLDAVPNKSPDDELLIERTRIAIASTTGNTDLRNQSLEAAMKSDRLPQEDRIKYSQALAQSYYNAKAYPKATEWLNRYFKEGGTDPEMRQFLAMSYYLDNDYAHAADIASEDIRAAEAAGKAPPESRLRLLASCGQKLKNETMRSTAIEKFVAYYPKKEHWADLLNGVLAKPGFPDQLTLDVYRLMHATGQLTTAKDYVDMSQLALLSGYPVEAQNIADEGIKKGLLGKGPDAAKHKQVREAAAKSAATETRTLPEKAAEAEQAKKAAGLVDIGFAYVERGQYDKGIGMMEQGIRAGGLKQPEVSKLHLGVAYVMANKKAEAIDTFKAVKGSDSTAELAKYWTLHLAQADQNAVADLGAPQSSGSTGTSMSSGTSQN